MKPLMIHVGDQAVPHWVSFPEEVWIHYESFPEFLKLVWTHLGLPPPTEAQVEIAHRLQYGADSVEWARMTTEEKDALQNSALKDIIRCFRSAGKSYITAAFVIWRLMRNPRDEKALVVSASGSKANKFVSQVKSILTTLPLCQWLIEGPRDRGQERRDKADSFDVALSSLAQSTSVKAAGITGQITGDRATLVIADDVEVPLNVRTEEARNNLYDITGEFSSIGKTEHGDADIIYLGTPQTEESIYNRIVKERGYKSFCVPVRWPQEDKLANYVLERDDKSRINILAPYLQAKAREGLLKPGQMTDTRLSLNQLIEEESQGRSRFMMQFMLDSRLSDAERYPLRQNDLIVFECNPLKAPMTVQWGHHNDRKNVITTIPNLGFSGDTLLRPLFVDPEWRDYEASVLFVDPAGRGKDETAWAVMKALNGMLYLLHVGAEVADPATAMTMIAQDAKRFAVNIVEVEPNFGQGMWVTAFQPILQQVWKGGCTVQESEWAKGQKEVRIIDTLEPVMTQHRLVVSESVLKADTDVQDRSYSLLYQMTHITRERGCLSHDDRLDAVAGAVAHYTRTMAQDTQEAAQAVLESEMEAEIEDFLEGLNSPGDWRRPRGVMRNGARSEVYRTGSW